MNVIRFTFRSRQPIRCPMCNLELSERSFTIVHGKLFCSTCAHSVTTEISSQIDARIIDEHDTEWTSSHGLLAWAPAQLSISDCAYHLGIRRDRASKAVIEAFDRLATDNSGNDSRAATDQPNRN